MVLTFSSSAITQEVRSTSHFAYRQFIMPSKISILRETVCERKFVSTITW